MKYTKFLLIICLFAFAFSATSCCRSSNQMLEDSKSARRHMSRGVRTLGGKQGDSRAVQCRDEFMPMEDGYDFSDNMSMEESPAYSNMAPIQTIPDFIPLSDQENDNMIAMGNYISRQPRETPGDPGSSIPGIDAFQNPEMNTVWSRVFHNIQFDYNSNLVKGQRNLEAIHAIANYLKNNPGVYVFVEGHCDERGPEAYNLALGSRRANAVRNMLIQEGVHPDNVFTISYGRERPLIHGQYEEAWAQNRRAEFKVYQR